MYVNLELSVSKEIVAYETMVKLLAISKSPSSKGCYLIRKREAVIRRVYLPHALEINFFFCNLTCSRYEGFKN